MIINPTGAEFSTDRTHRYALWRLWDQTKPRVMFIGLNPSTADEKENDPTIRRVISFAKDWGYGGVYMLNCFSYITSDPKKLEGFYFHNRILNDSWLRDIGRRDVSEIIFAWGNFKLVKTSKRDQAMLQMFPNAKALVINKHGSPRHPLYVKGNVKPIQFLP